MPLFAPNTAYGRLAGSWRTWDRPWIHRSGSWEQPLRVWVYSAGSWRIVWTAGATDAVNPVATLNGTEVDVTFDAPAGTNDDPEVATSYNVHRSDGTLVGSVTASGGTYLVTDSLPLAGEHAYTIYSLIDGVEYTSVETNTVTLGVIPGTPTAATSNVGTDTDVTVAWGAAPGAVSYNVYNINDTFLGNTASLTFTDTNPKSGVGGYSVEAVLANGDTGTRLTTNSLTLAQAPSSLNAAAPTSGDNVALTWSVAGVGDHDQIQVVRGGVSLVNLAAGSTSYTDTNGREGTVESYQVRAKISGNAGPYSNTDTSAIPANVPTSVSAVSTSTLGQLKMTWGNPSGSYTGYETQYYTDPGSVWTANSDGTSPAYRTWAAGTGLRYMRVRTLSAGGASGWVQVQATPLWDNSPPPLPTITSWKPESSYGRMVIRFTASSSDNYQYEVNFRINGGGWNFANVWNSLANSQSIARELTTSPNSTNSLDVRVRVRDSYLNTSGWTSIKNYTLATSPTNVFADYTGHNRQGVWGYDSGNPDRTYQGYYSNINYTYLGFIFYGNKISNATEAGSSFGGKKTVTGMNVSFFREGGGNAVQDCLYVGQHNMQNYPGTSSTVAMPTIYDTSCIMTLTYGEGKLVTLPSVISSSLASGYMRGLALQAFKPYLFLNKLSAQSSQGRIDVWHLG